jgi:hypothetical protein
LAVSRLLVCRVAFWPRLASRLSAAGRQRQRTGEPSRDVAERCRVEVSLGQIGRINRPGAVVAERCGLLCAVIGLSGTLEVILVAPEQRGQGLLICVNDPSAACRYFYRAAAKACGGAMMKPVPDKAEIALEYPEKLYVGTFERSSRFEAHLDPTGFSLILERFGDEDVRKSIHMHINFGLFACIISELASSVKRIPKDDIVHRDQLARAVAELHMALNK